MNLKAWVGGCVLLIATTGCALMPSARTFTVDDLQGSWRSNCMIDGEDSYMEVLLFEGDLLTHVEANWYDSVDCAGDPDDWFSAREMVAIGDVMDTEEESLVQEITFMVIESEFGATAGQISYESFSIVDNQLFLGYHANPDDYGIEGNHPTVIDWSYPYTLVPDEAG
jgi:hypothetical protein